MTCRKCGSNNINVQIINEVEEKKHGCLWWLLIGWWWKLIWFIFFGWWYILFCLIRGKQYRNVKKTICVCQNCGHQWEK